MTGAALYDWRCAVNLCSEKEKAGVYRIHHYLSVKMVLPPLLIDTGSLFEWARSPYLLEQIQDRVICANCP